MAASDFPLPLVLRDGGMKGGSRSWILAEPFRFREWTVPAGFVTDGASVPRVFWSLFSPTGSYLGAAVVHDFLYATKPIGRKEADGVFLAAMEAAGVGWLTRRTVYAAVRAGGWIAWR